MKKHITPTEVAAEWLERAEEEKATAAILMKDQQGAPTVICFLSHQIAEKSFKAILIAKANRLPHIHDLPDLVDLVTAQIPDAHDLYNDAAFLNPYYRGARYPGTMSLKSFTWEVAQAAFSAAERIYEFAKKTTRLSTESP